MKEDAQLICPVSYEDTHEIWAKLQSVLLERLPLREVTWKNPISSTYVTIDKLPLRCLISSANLFKDTDHAFRWFLAPYVNLYLLSAETLDNYKSAKASIKKWVDTYNGPKKSPWLIVYIPYGQHSVDVYSKIYSRLCSDFYGDRAGDRSVMLLSPPRSIDDTQLCFGVRAGNNAPTLALIQLCESSVTDLLNKLREGVVVSFQHRSAMYDSDIRRLDSYRGTAQFDFRTLFLVKESLALMYQMMQLPDRALGVYEELEATLGFAPEGVLLESDWPMVSPEPLKPTSGVAPPSSGGGVTDGDTPQKMNNNATKASSPRVRDALSDACKNGEDVVAYSINLARMKILQKKMSLLELHRYVFARQMFFLLSHLERPVACAEKALAFMRLSSAMIDRRLDERYLQSIREHENVVTESLSASGKFCTVEPNDEPLSPQSAELVAAAEVTANLTRMYNLRRKQATLWLLTACVKVVRVCRDLTARILQQAAATTTVGDADRSMSQISTYRDGAANASSHHIMSYRLDYSVAAGDKGAAGDLSVAMNSGSVSNGSVSSIGGPHYNNISVQVQRDAARALSEIMQFAVARLRDLVPHLLGSGGASKQALCLARSLCSAGGIDCSAETCDETTPDFLALLERELSTGGFDQDSISSLSNAPASPADNNLLVSVALKVRANSAAWAVEFAVTPAEQSPSGALFSESGASASPARPRSDSEEPVSQSTTTRARVHEVSLAVLVFKAQWELLQLADRPRFVAAAQLRCADVLLSCGMLSRASQFIETVMRQGLLCSSDYYLPPILSAAALSEVVNGGCVSSRALNLDSGVKLMSQMESERSETQIASRSHVSCDGGDWLEARFWMLLKLLYCATHNKDSGRLRIFASQLLHPCFEAAVSRCSSIQSLDLGALRCHLQDRLCALSVRVTSDTKDRFDCCGSADELLLPLLVYFDATVIATPPHLSGSQDASTREVLTEKCGFEVVHDEVHPVSVLQCTGGLPLYIVTLKLHSSLPSRLAVDRLAVVYSKFNADTIMITSVHNASASVNSLPSTPIVTPLKRLAATDCDSAGRFPHTPPGPNAYCEGTVCSWFALAEDEFVCVPCSPNGSSLHENLFIEPGTQYITLRFSPPVIGEFRLDRIVIAAGSLTFATNLLSECDSKQDSNSGTINAGVGSSSSSTATYSPVPSSPKPLHSHADLQRYFDRHFLIKVAAPEDLLQLRAVTPAFSPRGQLDDVSLQFATGPDEVIEELVVTARHLSDISDENAGGGEQLVASPEKRVLQPPGVSLQSISGGDGIASGGGGSFYDSHQQLGERTPGRVRGATTVSQQPSETAATSGIQSNGVNVTVRDTNGWVISVGGPTEGQAATACRWTAMSRDTVLFDVVPSSHLVEIEVPFIAARSITTGGNANRPRPTKLRLFQTNATLNWDVTGSVEHVQYDGERNDRPQSLSACATAATTITVTLSGRTLRNGCRILFEVTANFSLLVGEALCSRVTTDRSIPSDSGLPAQRAVQLVLCNTTPVSLQLLGFSVSPVATHVLGGPLDISDLTQGGAVRYDGLRSVLLAPGERYHAGFLLSSSSSSTGPMSDDCDPAIDFTYRRVNDQMLQAPGGVAAGPISLRSECTQKVFTKRVPFSVITAHDDLNSERQPSMTLHALYSPNSETGGTCTARVTVGSVASFRYILEVVVPMEAVAVGPAADGTGELWRYSDCSAGMLPSSSTGNDSCEGDHDLLCEVTAGTVTGLSVVVCETALWLVVGSSHRQLETKRLIQEKTQPAARGESTQSRSSVRIVYQLEVLLVAAVAGPLALPPLMVEWTKGPSDTSEVTVADSVIAECAIPVITDSSAKLLYPNSLRGVNSVWAEPLGPADGVSDEDDEASLVPSKQLVVDQFVSVDF